MKIIVVGPTPEYVDYAGPKIRYRRIMPELAQRGIDVEILDIGQFDPHAAESDVVVFSKCHDPRALVSAAILRNRGVLVGVDLFDDYFSQQNDSRLTRFRTWLAQLLPICDFALCSTPRMAEVIRNYRAGMPTLIMNDPAPAIDLASLSRSLSTKIVAAHEMRRIRIGWFGVGDNPHFRVGLHDLQAFGGALRMLRRCGMDMELCVLTNARALTAQGLAQIRRLPVRTRIEEWSEGGEQALLEEALFVFLPVNCSSFSIAKSLNRAVTALTAGCQVLSAGYPLYAPLEPLIYRDPAELAYDIGERTLRLRSETLDSFQTTINSHASAQSEVARLQAFLDGLERSGHGDESLALVHGHSTNGAVHKMVQAAGGLSVASPACSTEFGFDLIFKHAADRMVMLVSAKALSRLPPTYQDRLRPAGTLGGRKFFAMRAISDKQGGPVSETGSLPFQLATYTAATEEIADRVTELFGSCRVIVSETSPLPFRPAV